MPDTKGVELMRQLNDGQVSHTIPSLVAQAQRDVTAALEELIETGVRVRPLYVDGKRTGWVRGVHLSERKALRRWVTDEVEFLEHLVRLATSLDLPEIRGLSLIELRSLTRVIKAMSDSDLKLYPYVSAFVTTSTSEQLWYSHGVQLTSFRDRSVPLPDGKQVRVSVPSDQAKP